MQNLSKSIQAKFCLAQRLDGVRIKTQQKLHLQAVKMPISSVFFPQKKGMSIISVAQDRLTVGPCELQPRLQQPLNGRTTAGRNG